MPQAPLDNPTSRLGAEDLSSGHTSHHEERTDIDAWTMVVDTIHRVFTPGGRRPDLRSLHGSGDRPTADPVLSDNAAAAADDNSSNVQPASTDSQLPAIGDVPSVHDTNQSTVRGIASPPEAETSVASHDAVSDTASIQDPGQSVTIRLLAREQFAHISPVP